MLQLLSFSEIFIVLMFNSLHFCNSNNVMIGNWFALLSTFNPFKIVVEFTMNIFILEYSDKPRLGRWNIGKHKIFGPAKCQEIIHWKLYMYCFKH